ncbi:MAG TPA: glycoside hydrolase family 38 C-terminal domain-containing protein [Candidatus Lokiarchaeia archaeon]|nr:glycoside hydrolase family 38 C-terminal domain-containing protein [Candidatus Lokiarchaeia archaeon]
MAKNYTGFVISHTHWDREWYLTFLEFRIRLVKLVDKLLHVCAEVPAFDSFQLDGQTLPIEDYLALRPENEGLLKKYISERRIVVGPWYVLADEFLESGEGIIRNLLLGHKIAQKCGGEPMKVGYVPDTFGHVAQLPQILAGFGIKYSYLFRGYPPLFGGHEEYKGCNDNFPLEYFWAAPDGTTVLALHHITGYGNAAVLCQSDPAQAALPDLKYVGGFSRILMAHAALAPRTTTDYMLFMNGSDHLEPEEEIPEFIEAWNANEEIPEEEDVHVQLKHAKLVDYFQAVEASGVDFPTIAGEMRGSAYTQVTPGCISTRMYLKQLNFECQRNLERYAEPLAAIAWALCGTRYESSILWEAWRWVLQNHPHDSICGCSLDRVHEDMETRFAWSLDLSYQVANKALAALCSSIKFPDFGGVSAGMNFAVWNLSDNILPQLITGLLPLTGAGAFRLLDENGEEVPGVVTQAIPDYRDLPRNQHLYKQYSGHWRLVRVSFLAPLPSYGFRAFKIVEGAPTDPEAVPDYTSPVSVNGLTVDNGRIRVEFHPNGSFDLTDCETTRVFRECHLFEDMADDGDEYDYSPLPNEEPLTTRDLNAEITNVLETPLKASFQVTLNFEVPQHLEGDWRKGETRIRSNDRIPLHITSVISIVAGQKLVDIQTSVKNVAQDHRLRVIFPTDLETAYSCANDHFTTMRRTIALPRDDGWFQPMQGIYHQDAFVDVSDDQDDCGLAILNRGMPEYEILPTRNTIALTLFRAVGWLSKQTHLGRPTGLNGPALATPGAQCLRDFAFEYAVFPHVNNWMNEELNRVAQSYVVPPLVHVMEGRLSTENTLAPGVSILSVSNPLIWVSAVKKAENADTFVIRVYNTGDSEQTATISLGMPVESVFFSDLLENPAEQVPLQGDSFEITLPSSKIQSYLVQF